MQSQFSHPHASPQQQVFAATLDALFGLQQPAVQAEAVASQQPASQQAPVSQQHGSPGAPVQSQFSHAHASPQQQAPLFAVLPLAASLENVTPSAPRPSRLSKPRVLNMKVSMRGTIAPAV